MSSYVQWSTDGQTEDWLTTLLSIKTQSPQHTYLSSLKSSFEPARRRNSKSCPIMNERWVQQYKLVTLIAKIVVNNTKQQLSDKTWARTGPRTLLVTEDSARRIGLSNYDDHQPLSTDHRGLVRFDHSNDENYQKVIYEMKELCNEAVGIIQNRFSVDNS